MKSSRKDFIIPFEGLKVGIHTFEFNITDAFFTDYDGSLIEKASVNVLLDLDKKESMMIAEFEVDGNVETTCARCNDPVEEYIYGEYKIIYKFGSDESEDEDLIVLPYGEYEIDLNDLLYELISVSMPARSIHDEGDCNENVAEFFIGGDDDEDESDEEEDNSADDDNGDDDDDIDPRWSALKNLN